MIPPPVLVVCRLQLLFVRFVGVAVLFVCALQLVSPATSGIFVDPSGRLVVGLLNEGMRGWPHAGGWLAWAACLVAGLLFVVGSTAVLRRLPAWDGRRPAR